MRFRLLALWLTGVLLALDCPTALRGQERHWPPPLPPLGELPLPPLGELPLPPPPAKQCWADELFFHQWRIQRNVLTGQCQLVDDDNVRYAAGTLVACRQALEEIKRQKHLPPMQGTGVILLHGLGDTRTSMAPLARYIQKHSDFTVFNVTYPSIRQGIEDNAQSLARIVEGLDGIDQIHFVGHSLGNIVVRRYLADQTDPSAGRRPDPRIRRMVMLGPPNHGSIAAAKLGDNVIFRVMTGETGQELGREWVWLESSLATPQFEFGIIAGGLGNKRGINPLLPGDNDGVVTVQSTRLAGARDFLAMPILHALLPVIPKVHEYTLRFLNNGYFISADRRQPVEARGER